MKNKILIIAGFVFASLAGHGQKLSTIAHKIQNSSLRSIENKGQWEDNVDFRVNLSCGKLFLEPDGFAYHLISDESILAMTSHESHAENHGLKGHTIDHHGLKMSFVNRNANCTLRGMEGHPTKYNYYLGDDPAKWASGALAFKGVQYKELYDGIDLFLYEYNGNLKYDLVVAPAVSPSQIVLKYKGADQIKLEDGKIKITTSVNEIVEQKPIAYQLLDGKYTRVACNFVLTAQNEIKFEFPNGYYNGAPLIIDPELIFSTYSGSFGDNWGFTATYDQFGNAFSGGISWAGGGNGGGYPTTLGAYQSVLGGGITDVAISKYSSNGSTLLYATYLGGNGEDQPMSIVVNNNNQLVILGNTNSMDFPTTAGVFDDTLNNGISIAYDLFVSILSSSGTSLTASGFIGGDANDGFNDMKYFYGDEYRSEVIVDAEDNIYVASNTNSSNFPVTTGSFGASWNGAQDGCVSKLNNDISKLLWSGYLGGFLNDQVSGIALDSFNNVYVCGGTEGSGFPTTLGTIQPTFSGGFNTAGTDAGNFQGDGFVTKIDSGGTSIIASTFLQSTDTKFDLAYLIETDEEQNLYVFGITEGNYPISPGVYSNGQSSQFIHKLNTDLTTSLFSSTFGNGLVQAFLAPTALMVDNCFRIYVAGWGGQISFQGSVPNIDCNISNYPTSSDALQSSTDGSDFYLAVFDQDMTGLNYATYYGGDQQGGNGTEHVDGGTSRFSPEGIVYQAVCAGCGGNSLFPATAGAYSTTNNNATNCNAAVFKMEFAQKVVDAIINNQFIDTLICANASIVFHNNSVNANFYNWDFGDGQSLTTLSDSSVHHRYANSGVYEVTLISSNDGNCFIKSVDTAIYRVKIAQPPVPQTANDTTINTCDTIQLYACCGVSYRWEPAAFFIDNTLQDPILTSDVSNSYQVTITDSIGCESTDSIQVNIIEVEPFIPNIITPNGDDMNDYFVLDGFCRTNSLTLYNRWGRQVYYTPDYQNNFNGLDVPDGLYYYYIENSLKSYKGWLEITR